MTRWAAASLLLGLAGCAGTAKGGEEGRPPVHGSLSSRYRARWTNRDDDHDLVEVLSAEMGDAKQSPVTGFVMAQATADLDGRSPDGGQAVFHSLADTYEGAVTGRLFHAYADFHAARAFDVLRIGRQMIVETPMVAYFDGLRAETKEMGKRSVLLGAYGGIPVQLFASSTAGDSMVGLFAQLRPWRGGRARIDWMHVEEDEILGPLRNDLCGLGAWQAVGEKLRLEAETTRLESRERDARFRASWTEAESDLVVQASWYRLLATQKDLTIPFDPLFATLFELFPYEQYGLLVSKGLGGHVDVQTGLDLRRVVSDEDVGQFNHDFDRGFVTAGLKDVLPAGLGLSVTGEVWDSPQSDIRTFGADLSRRFGERVDASVGTFYSLFKYDLYQDRELDDVRTWYLKLLWKRAASATFDLRYEFEDDDIDEYHSVRVGATWRF